MRSATVLAFVALAILTAPHASAQTWLLDPAFAPAVERDGGGENVSRLEVDAAGRVFAAGAFHRIDGVPRAGLARFLADGTLDRGFAPPANATWLLLPPDGRIIVSIDGAARRLRDDGAIDAAFVFPAGLDPRTTRWLLGAPDGRLLISAFEPDDKLEENLKLIWLGPDGKRLATLATRFAGYARATPGHFRIIGVPDPLGMPAFIVTDQWVPASSQPINRLASARLLPDGRLVVAGSFQAVNDTAQSDIVWLRADGSVDGAEPPSSSGTVTALGIIRDSLPPLPLSDGRAIRIERAALGSDPARVTRLLPDGSIDPNFRPPAESLGVDARVLADDSFWSGGRRFLADGWPDRNFSAPTLRDGKAGNADAALRHPDGALWIGGRFDSIAHQRRAGLARFLPRDVPAITVQPENRQVVAGRSTFVRVTLGTSQSASIQWQRNSQPVSGATTTMLELRPARVEDSGSYRAVVTLGDRVLTSEPAQLDIAPNTSRLINFSALTQIEPDVPLVAGWISDVPAARPVLLRAFGRGLDPGNTGLLATPQLSLYRDGQRLAHDSGSAGTAPVVALARSLGAVAVRFPAYPSLDLGAALTPALEAGVFTAIVTSGDRTPGVGLFEFYDTAQNSEMPGALRNISVLGSRTANSTPLTVGFVVTGNGPVRVLVRGLGPALAAFGLAEPLPDPWMSVRGRRRWVDNYGSAAEIATATREAGAYPLPADGRDAVMVLELEPDNYLAELYSSSARTGRGLIEVYVLHP